MSRDFAFALAFALGYPQDAAEPLALETEFRLWRKRLRMEPTHAHLRRLKQWEMLFARRFGMLAATPEMLERGGGA